MCSRQCIELAGWRRPEAPVRVFQQQRPHMISESARVTRRAFYYGRNTVELLSGWRDDRPRPGRRGVDTFRLARRRCFAYLRCPVHDCKVPHVLVRHEQAATHAADGYACATGKPGRGAGHPAPATNAITGIATAYMDSIPMVVCQGRCRAT